MSLDIEGTLSAHVRECFDEWCGECLCGWLVPEDATDFTAAHHAHVAAVLRAQIEGALAEARQQGSDDEFGDRLLYGMKAGSLTRYTQAKAWDEGYLRAVEPESDIRDNPYRAAHLSDTERAGDAQ